MDWTMRVQEILVIPLFIYALIQTIKERDLYRKNQLSAADRRTVRMTALFAVAPVFTFIHELGHAFMVVYFGGTVLSFHSGLFSGMVEYNAASFSTEQRLIVALAGVVTELILCYLALLIAFLVKSPPVVALLCYSSLCAIAFAFILYPLNIFFSPRNDWLQIYYLSDRQTALAILACHATIIYFVIFALYSNTASLWFALKTNPQFKIRYEALSTSLAGDKTGQVALELAWLCYAEKLSRMSEHYVNIAKKLGAPSSELLLLNGWLSVDRRRFSLAKQYFNDLAQLPDIPENTQAKALIALGHVAMNQAFIRGSDQQAHLKEALEAYSRAAQAAPNLGDPRYYMATTLYELGLKEEARTQLNALANLNWLDNGAKVRALALLKESV